MMGGYGTTGGFHLGGMELFLIFTVLVLVLATVGIIVLVRWMIGTMGGSRARGGSGALEILRERYARGEIDKAEFDQKRRDLGG